MHPFTLLLPHMKDDEICPNSYIYYFNNKCLPKSKQYSRIYFYFLVCQLYDKSSSLEIRLRVNSQLNLLIKNIKKTLSQKNKTHLSSKHLRRIVLSLVKVQNLKYKHLQQTKSGRQTLCIRDTYCSRSSQCKHFYQGITI